MCHKCETKCSPKHAKQCVEKKVIRCLPYLITKPGYYCLGKDFTWSDASQSAITVTADNVVLDFNQRKITTDVASVFPFVKVEDSVDVVLKNVHLEAVDTGKYLRGGISIQNCKNVVVDSPVLLNLDGQFASLTNNALACVSTEGLEVFNLYLKNDNDSVRTNGINFDDVKSLIFRDSKVYNVRTLCQNSQNTDFLRLHIDNNGSSASIRGLQIDTNLDSPFFNIPAENVRVAECNIKVKNTGLGIFIASFPSGLDSNLYIRNVVIENNIIIGATYQYAIIVFIAVNGGIIRGNSFDLINGGNANSSSGGMILDSSIGLTVSQNNFYIKSNVKNTFCVGILVEGSSSSLNGATNLISENNIIKTGEPIATYDTGISFWDSSATGIVIYNTVERNNISGFQYGIIDDFSRINSVPDIYARCTIFSNNFSNGNGQNYSYDTSDPVNSIFLDNNVDGCVNPDLVPPPPEALVAGLSTSEAKKMRRELFTELE